MFINPLETITITSPYGPRKSFTTENGYKTKTFHYGIDLRAAVGTGVKAVASGKVFFLGNVDGYGNKVILKHNNGKLSYYCHLSKFLVLDGADVEEGQIIALSGNTGNSTGAHLHFGIAEGYHGNYIDPTDLIGEKEFELPPASVIEDGILKIYVGEDADEKVILSALLGISALLVTSGAEVLKKD